MLVTLANILLRQASKTPDASAFLDALVTSKYNVIAGQGGEIISTNINGKSATLQLAAGTSSRDIMVAAEMALAARERGMTKISRRVEPILK